MLKYLIDLGRAAPTCLPDTLVKKLRCLDDDSISSACGVEAEQIKPMAVIDAKAKNPVSICGRGVSKHGPEGIIGAFNIVRATRSMAPSGRWRLMELTLNANTFGARLFGHRHVGSVTGRGCKKAL